MDLQTKLLAFIRDHLAPDPGAIKSVEQPLISSGLIDSFALVELSTFIEEELGVTIPNPEMTAANFDSVALAAKTVARFQRG